MQVNRAQKWHRVEGRDEGLGHHGADQPAPAAGLPEDQMDPGHLAPAHREDGIHALVPTVVFQHFLNDDVVEGAGDGQHISEIGHRKGRRASALSASSL